MAELRWAQIDSQYAGFRSVLTMRFVDRFVQDEGSKALDGPLLQTESEWVDIGGPWKMYRHQSAYFTLYKGLILRLGHVLSVRCRKQASV